MRKKDYFMAKKQPKVSIIVPVFNVESYLEKCINSILLQIYQNIQIILVNDGSTDSSGKMCDDFALAHKNIKVVHTKNQGLSAARNTGLSFADGEFVCFVDSDDWIEPNMIEVLVEIAENGSNISICSFFEDYDDSTTTILLPNQTISSEQAFERFADDNGFAWVVAWNKLFKRELFKDVEFPVGKIHEDQFVIHRLFGKAKTISTTSTPLYHHINRADNISNGSKISRHFDDIDAVFERVAYFEKNNLSHFVASAELQVFKLMKFYVGKAFEACNLSKADLKKLLAHNKKCLEFAKQQNLKKEELDERKKLYHLTLWQRFKLRHFAKIRKIKHLKTKR